VNTYHQSISITSLD